MLISCGVFAYSVNAIGNIINSYREDDLEKEKKMHFIIKYMHKNNIKPGL